MNIQLTIISPRGTCVGNLQTLHDAQTEELKQVITHLQETINDLLTVTILTADGEEMTFGQKILQQSVISFKLI